MSMQKSNDRISKRERGFSLFEVITALIILGLTCSSILTVMDRNIHSTYNVTMRLRALEVARENLEAILVSQTVKEMIETGTTETSPPIDWENAVETFYSPVNGDTWARARCSATYEDMDGQVQSVELEHWLTAVSDEQLQALDDLNSEGIEPFSSIADAAAYTGVTEDDIETWTNNDMPLTEDGKYIPEVLDLYQRTDGHPTPDEIAQVLTRLGIESDVPSDMEGMSEGEAELNRGDDGYQRDNLR